MQKGFTLIELMVSVTIFVIVMVISLGALLSISAAERKAETLKTVMNNLNFGLDSMSRSIRTGINYHCGSTGTLYQPQDCSGGGTYLAFEAVGGNTNNSNDQVVYRYEPSAATCGTGSVGGCIMRSQASGAPNTFYSITAPGVAITSLNFYVVGSVPQFQSDPTNSQPKVVITVTGEISSGTAQPTKFSLQTTVTQRLYDQ